MDRREGETSARRGTRETRCGQPRLPVGVACIEIRWTSVTISAKPRERYRMRRYRTSFRVSSWNPFRIVRGEYRNERRLLQDRRTRNALPRVRGVREGGVLVTRLMQTSPSRFTPPNGETLVVTMLAATSGECRLSCVLDESFASCSVEASRHSFSDWELGS